MENPEIFPAHLTGSEHMQSLGHFPANTIPDNIYHLQ